MDNSIELFNCPLCSFCETGLDRLVRHIREHIKPEPKSASSSLSHAATDTTATETDENGLESVMPREQQGVTEHKELHLDDYIHNLSSAAKDPQNTISLFTPDPLTDEDERVNQTNNSSDDASKLNTTHPKPVSSSDAGTTKHHHQQHKTSKGFPPPTIQTMQLSPPTLQPPPVSQSMMYMHKDAPQYVQIHPRDHFTSSAPPYGHPQQPFLNKSAFAHASDQYVPIAPAKAASFQDGKGGIQPMDVHDGYHRGGGGGHHHQSKQQPQYAMSPHHRSMVPMKGHRPDMHGGYAIRPNMHSPQQKYHSPPQQRQQGGSMQYHHQYQQRGATGEHQMQARVQSRINNMQNVDLPNVGFPNNGTLLLNPEQLLKMSGNTSNLDQLAGLLVVPLKKTMEIAIQTDPVEIEVKKPASNSITSGVQTDLRMQYVSEEARHTPTPVFDQIRSTDGLIECLICGEEYVNDQQLQSHMTSTHKHVCENCFHASTSLQEHNAHVTECGKCDAELLCMDCNNLFPSIKKLNQHRIKIHSVRMPFRCGICNQPFETHDAVMHHMASHDNDVPEFKCRYCTKVFQSADALTKHFQRHKMVDVEYQCRFCRKVYNTDKLLRDHIGIDHVIKDFDYDDPVDNEATGYQQHVNTSSVTSGNQSSGSNKKYFLCRYCDLAFKNRELLSRHVKNCLKNGSMSVTCFVCDICKEFFESDNARKQHLKNDHRRQNGYRCPKCSKVYRTWTRLKFHTKQQHLKKNCPDCSLIFTKEHVLRKHQEDIHGKTSTQNGDRVYKCSDCNLSMYTLTDLTQHRRTLHPDRNKASKNAGLSSNATMLSFVDNPINETKILDEELLDKQDNDMVDTKDEINTRYTCERCNASFEDEKRLKNHLGLTHGERPFVCDICNKRFQYSSQIIWHMKNHNTTNNNPTTTTLVKTSNSLWKAKTTLASKLKPKRSSSLGSMNYVCQFCGARFKQEKLLKNHKGVAHKIKLFSCYICDAKFGHSTELIWHVRTCKAKFIRENPGAALPAEQNAAEATAAESEIVTQEQTMSIITEETFENGSDHLVNIQPSPQQQPSPPPELPEDLEMPGTNIQLSKEEAEELLQNDPEYDHGRGEYTCPLCKKTTKSITGMKTHYGRVHGIWGKESSHKFANGHKVTFWPCRNCDREFQSFEEIQAHCLELHGLTVSKEDLDFEARTEFVKNPPEASLYTCQSCGMAFDNSKSIRVHTFKKHGILLNDISLNESRNENLDLNSVVSPAATKKQKTEPSVSAANAMMSGEEIRYKCQRCKSQFRTPKSLRVHSFKRHGVILTKPDIITSKKWVTVDADSLQFPPPSSSASLNLNKGRDLIESPNPCDRCGRVFGNYRALFTHYRQAHRITDPSHVYVPKKMSRTERSIQNFSPSQDSSSSETQMKSPSNHGINGKTTKQSPEVADSVDCPKCLRVFTNHKSFVAHLYSAHKVSKDQYSTYWPNGIPILPRESSLCPTCNKECLDKRAMRIHMFKAHGTHYRDYAADKGSSKSGALGTTEGMVTMVNEPLLSETSYGDSPIDTKPIEQFICSVCSRVCKNHRSLFSHEFSAHGIRWEHGKRLSADDPRYNKPTSGLIDLNGSATMINNQQSPWASGTASSSTPVNKPFHCSLCSTAYHNKRALTTHLCRVHKLKRDEVKEYFKNNFSNDLTMSSLADTPSGSRPTENDNFLGGGEIVKIESDYTLGENELDGNDFVGNEDDSVMNDVSALVIDENENENNYENENENHYENENENHYENEHENDDENEYDHDIEIDNENENESGSPFEEQQGDNIVHILNDDGELSGEVNGEYKSEFIDQVDNNGLSNNVEKDLQKLDVQPISINT